MRAMQAQVDAGVGREMKITRTSNGRTERSDRKRASIIAAATTVFLRNGYGVASMDAIAREAEVSKQTIYHHFGGKAALFGAIIDERCHRLLSPFSWPDTATDDPRAVLVSIARQFVDIMLAPSSLALYRALMAEVERFPTLGHITYESGPSRIVASISRYLEEQNAAGRLNVPDTVFAAEQFYGMLTGHLQLRALLGVETSPSPERTERVVQQAVDTMLCLYGRR